MKDETTPQDAKALPPASHGSVAVGVVEHARKCVDFWRNMMSATDRIVVFDAPSLAIGGVADLVDDLLAEIARLRLTNYVMLEAVGEIEQLRGSIEWHKEVLVEAEEKMVRLRLTDAERDAIRRLSPRGDPLASRTVTLTPTERRVFHGLLERMGGGE